MRAFCRVWRRSCGDICQKCHGTGLDVTSERATMPRATVGAAEGKQAALLTILSEKINKIVARVHCCAWPAPRTKADRGH